MNSYPLAKKTVLVTGATSGMGRRIAGDLAEAGATVLLHGRDRGRVEQTASDILTAVPDATLGQYVADLADLDQVRGLAADVAARESRLDVLVNNAVVGTGADRSIREVNAQGIELRLAVNYLAPVLLIQELLPVLSAAAPARVVNVASIGQAPIDFDNIQLEHDYEGLHAYCQSKLALIMSTFDMSGKLAELGITANALHPAHLMDTPGLHDSGFIPVTTVQEGALPTLRLIGDPDLDKVTGRYFNQFTDTRAHDQAYDATARTRLAALTHQWLATA